MRIVRRGDNFRRDIPEAQKFIYPNDSERLTGKKAQNIGIDLFNTLFNIVRAPDSVGRIYEEVRDIANRPVATPKLHKQYLDNKYGDKQWDVYVDRNNQEAYNPDFYYNQQDLGNGSTFTQRESKRFAGDLLSDEWLEDIRLHGLEQDTLMEAVELNRQRGVVDAIHGKKVASAFLDPNNRSVSSEQQIARDLLFGNGTGPIVAPPDRILGSSLDPSIVDNYMGVDGRFKSNSEVRRNVVQNTSNPDLLDITRGDVYTEAMSPAMVESTFKRWKEKTGETSRERFNDAFGEYYGQQAMKIMGAKAPTLQQRSNMVQNAVGLNEVRRGSPGANLFNTGAGDTDRLIEWKSGLTADNVQRMGYKGSVQNVNWEPADYRYIDAQGEIAAADYQRGDLNETLRLNLFKGSELKPGQEADFERQLGKIAQDIQSDDLDEIMQVAVERGVIGAPRTGKWERDGTQLTSGFRAGKFTADGEFMGQEHSLDNNMRNQGVLFGLHGRGQRGLSDGMYPEDLKFMYGDDTRKALGRSLLESGTMGGELRVGQDGALNLRIDGNEVGSALTPQEMLNVAKPLPANDIHKRRYTAPTPAVNAVARTTRRRTSAEPDLSKMTPQERYDYKQQKLQERFGGPRVDPNWTRY